MWTVNSYGSKIMFNFEKDVDPYTLSGQNKKRSSFFRFYR